MNLFKDNPRNFDGLRCGQRKRPSALLLKHRTPKSRLLFNFLKFSSYESKSN